MKKEEIITAILNRISDPYTDTEEDIAFCEPIDLPYATKWIAEIRQEDIDNANDDEFRMPNAATPELLMEAFNCRIRLAKRNITINHLAEWIKGDDPTALYDNYREYMEEAGYSAPAVCVIPIDFLTDGPNSFCFDEEMSALELILIGKNSPDFDPEAEYCWFDAKNRILHSVDNPWEDGILNAHDFAEYIIDTPDLKQFVIESYLTDEDIDYIFKYFGKEN